MRYFFRFTDLQERNFIENTPNALKEKVVVILDSDILASILFRYIYICDRINITNVS